MKYGKDERFKGIEKMKDREALFVEFLAELKKKEKENAKLKHDKVGFLFLWGGVRDEWGNSLLVKLWYQYLDSVSDWLKQLLQVHCLYYSAY